jgi:ketosteroid isomerase-like protein
MIVRLVVRRAFRDLNADRLDQFLAVFRPDAVFRMYGDHALGGEVRGRPAVRAAFERIHRLFPGMQVEPTEIVVGGMPWHTTVASRISVRASLPDGSTYRNEGMQYLLLRWGKVAEDRIYVDTAHLAAALQSVAATGVAEAAEPGMALVSP